MTIGARRRARGVPNARSVVQGRRAAASQLRRASRVKSWLWAGIQLSLLGAEIFLLLILLAQPAFRARQVEVTGTKHFGSSEVMTALALPEGRSIFLLNHRSLEARVRALPWVRAASVSLAVPDQVRVQVVEWLPLAVIQVGERSYYVGERGTILGQADEPGSLPVLERPGLRKPTPGTTAADPELLQLLLTLRDGFPNAFHLQVSSFGLDAQDSLTLRTDRGWTIVFGRVATGAERASVEAKLGALQALATKIDLRSAPIAYINLMDPRSPAVQMRGQ